MKVTLLPTSSSAPTTWHAYQRYYVLGLRSVPEVKFRYASLADAVLANRQERGGSGAHRLWQLLATARRAKQQVSSHVGRYLVELPDGPVRMAIDAHDNRNPNDVEALEWAQVYFKVSYWPQVDYGPKVHPLVCGNGPMDHGRIAKLVGMRQAQRDLDLTFIAKLWPGHPPGSETYWNPVEHLVRVFEMLAALPIRSHLRAIVPAELLASMPRIFIERLHRACVPVISREISLEELWGATSTSKLALLRPGMHLCVSWRMIDHLAMGACTVCDRAPYPRWPVPLQPGRELFDSGCGIGADGSLPDPADYARIADNVMGLLGDAERAEQARRAAAAYFDAHVAPGRVARYIVETAGAAAATSVESPPAHSWPAEPAVPLTANLDIVETGVHPSHTSLLEFTHDAVIIWEMNGRGILYWNRAAEQLYGFERSEAHGRNTHALLRTRLRDGVGSLEEALSRYGIWVGELHHTTRDGKSVIVEARLSVLSQSSGGWLVLEVNRDISDQKRAQAQSRLMQAQLEELRQTRLATPDE